MPKFKDISGQTFTRLTAIRVLSTAVDGKLWLCKCSCGNMTKVSVNRLTSGNTKSCGCLHKELLSKRLFRHGHAKIGKKTTTYNIWRTMIDRCRRPGYGGFANYGGRGIKVCERWRDFRNFLADMGERPGKLTIERIDNNKGYSPSNCRWATMVEQASNRRNTIRIKFQGEEKTLTEWSKYLNKNYFTLHSQITRQGMTIEDAFLGRG